MTAVSSDPAPDLPLQTIARGNAAGSVLRGEVITDFAQLDSLSAEWQRLWDSDCRAEIFQSPGWAKAWWRAYGSACTLCSVAVYEGDELVGIAPFVKRAGVVQFLGTPQADYADIICEPSRATAVLTVALDALVERVGGWSECGLQHLAKHSRLVRHYQELPPRLRRCLHVVPTENYRTIVLREKREEIFKELLGKNHTRRRHNKLQKAGKLQFRYLETRAEAQQYLCEFFRHHVRRMAVIGKKSACANAEFCNYLRALVDELDPSQSLRFAVLELDGRTLAWAFGFEANGKFMLYQHTFDVDAWDYTPGEVLLWKLLEYAKGKIQREFDFGSGAEAYKNRFTNYERETCRVFFQRPGVMGLTRGLVRQAQGRSRLAGSHLKQALQEHRPTLTALRTFRNRTAEILHGGRQGENHELLKHFLASFQRSPWNKRSLDLFVPGKPAAEDAAASVPNERVNIKTGSFGDLVDLALERSGLLSLSDLPQCRQRLKRGDRVYIVRENSHPTLLSWVTAASATDGAVDNPVAGANGNQSLMLMDECKAAQGNNSASYRELLSLVRHEAASGVSELAIACRENQSLLRSELLRQGFLPKN